MDEAVYDRKYWFNVDKLIHSHCIDRVRRKTKTPTGPIDPKFMGNYAACLGMQYSDEDKFFNWQDKAAEFLGVPKFEHVRTPKDEEDGDDAGDDEDDE